MKTNEIKINSSDVKFAAKKEAPAFVVGVIGCVASFIVDVIVNVVQHTSVWSKKRKRDMKLISYLFFLFFLLSQLEFNTGFDHRSFGISSYGNLPLIPIIPSLVQDAIK